MRANRADQFCRSRFSVSDRRIERNLLPRNSLRAPITYLRLLWRRGAATLRTAVARLQPSCRAHERPRSLRREDLSGGGPAHAAARRAGRWPTAISRSVTVTKRAPSVDLAGRSPIASHLPETFSDRTARTPRPTTPAPSPRATPRRQAHLSQRSECGSDPPHPERDGDAWVQRARLADRTEGAPRGRSPASPVCKRWIVCTIQIRWAPYYPSMVRVNRV